jgi:hypothetical protein
MYRIIKKYKDEIEKYCLTNNISVGNVFSSSVSEDDESVFILAPIDPERAKRGLADKVPSLVTLKIFLEDGKLRFEQTEYTRKYLGAEEEHDVVHTPRVAVAV